MMLVQASERHNSAGRPSLLTVRISSNPSRMLFETPGASRSRRWARLRISFSAFAASSSSQAWRNARRTEACRAGDSRSMMFLALWIWQHWIGVWHPKLRRIALASAFEPSMMNRRGTAGSRPRSIRSSINACTTALCSVAPSISPSGCLTPSLSIPSAATSTRCSLMWMPSICTTMISRPDRSAPIHSFMRAADKRHEVPRSCRLRYSGPRWRGNIALGKPHRSAEFPRRYVDQHQVHRPLAEPVLRDRTLPARQRQFMALEVAHAGPLNRHLAGVEADLALGSAPAMTAPAIAAGMASPASPLGVLFHHGSERLDPGRQTESIKADRNRVPSFVHSPHSCQRQSGQWCDSFLHGVAFLRGFDTPSLPAQGEQRRSSYFNIRRGNPSRQTRGGYRDGAALDGSHQAAGGLHHQAPG